jgi:hypothetical protein
MRQGLFSDHKPHNSTRHSLTDPKGKRRRPRNTSSGLWSRARLTEIPHADADSALSAPPARLTRFVLCRTHDQFFPLLAGLLGDPLLPQPQKKVYATSPLSSHSRLLGRVFFFYQYLLTRVVSQYPQWIPASPTSSSVNNSIPNDLRRQLLFEPLLEGYQPCPRIHRAAILTSTPPHCSDLHHISEILLLSAHKSIPGRIQSLRVLTHLHRPLISYASAENLRINS